MSLRSRIDALEAYVADRNRQFIWTEAMIRKDARSQDFPEDELVAIWRRYAPDGILEPESLCSIFEETERAKREARSVPPA